MPDYVPPHNVVVHYKPSGKTFDSTIIKEGVLKRVLMPHIMQQEIEKPLVFADSAPCHKTVEVNRAFRVAAIAATVFCISILYIEFFKFLKYNM